MAKQIEARMLTSRHSLISASGVTYPVLTVWRSTTQIKVVYRDVWNQRRRVVFKPTQLVTVVG